MPRIATFCHTRQSQPAVRPTRYVPRCNRVLSAKYTDGETGLVYYGYRYYQPGVGRWLSRDPIREMGGANLYVSVFNNPINLRDLFGLMPSYTPVKCKEITNPSGSPLILFDDADHWVLTGYSPLFVGAYDSVGVINGLELEWKANVYVGCRCKGFCDQPRSGTRKYAKVIKFEATEEVYLFKFGGGPVDVPKFTDILSGVGKVIAAILKKSLPALGWMDDDGQKFMAKKLAEAWPSKATDGAWDPRSPCD